MKILTLNIWGAPYARNHMARLQAICQKIKDIRPDLICLQEVYLENQRQLLIRNLAEIWQYYKYFHSGLLGSGLMILSQHPIGITRFHPFQLKGKPEKPHHGDYYAAKGIASARIHSPDGDVIVYNTHTHAQYSPAQDNEYAIYTNSNLYEAASFIRLQDPHLPFIICGDLNTRPDQLGYNIIIQGTGATDMYKSAHGEHPVTFASTNPYTTSNDQCLDYILANGVQSNTITIALNDQPDKLPAYSDHYGLLMDFILHNQIKSSFPHEPVPAFIQLHQQMTVALCELEFLRYQHFGKIVTAIFMIPDIIIITRLIKKITPRIVTRLRIITTLWALIITSASALHVWINLTNRYHVMLTLQAQLESEIRHSES